MTLSIIKIEGVGFHLILFGLILLLVRRMALLLPLPENWKGSEHNQWPDIALVFLAATIQYIICN